MASATPDNTIHSTSNDLLTYNSFDMAQINDSKASNSSQNNTADLHSRSEIPMNLLPAGNCQIFILIY
jgi:hypothetical protein